MPCNCDHLEATYLEKEMTKMFQVLDELNGKPINPEEWGNGYDRRAYSVATSKEDRDRLIGEICTRMKKMRLADIKKLSLEVQIWWRDHKAADKAKKTRDRK